VLYEDNRMPALAVSSSFTGVPSRHRCIRQYVEQRLSALFHRHAAVTPEAWVAYGEMCGLARDAYGLDVALPYIPPQPQDDGAKARLMLTFCRQGFSVTGNRVVCLLLPACDEAVVTCEADGPAFIRFRRPLKRHIISRLKVRRFARLSVCHVPVHEVI